MAGIAHAKVSAKTDGGDSTLVQPSDWNADHSITGDVAFAGYKATGLGAPTASGDAATKGYVDSNTAPASHVGAGGTAHAEATTSVAGFMSATDKTKLDGPSGALVGTTDTQTLTHKTVEAATFTNGYTEAVVTANTGTAYTIDLANGSVQILTLTGNCVFTFPAVGAGKSFLLVLKQDATGSRTVTWPSVTNPVKWPAGTAPTITATASRGDLYGFTSDGTNWIGRAIGQNYIL